SCTSRTLLGHTPPLAAPDWSTSSYRSRIRYGLRLAFGLGFAASSFRSGADGGNQSNHASAVGVGLGSVSISHLSRSDTPRRGCPGSHTSFRSLLAACWCGPFAAFSLAAL